MIQTYKPSLFALLMLESTNADIIFSIVATDSINLPSALEVTVRICECCCPEEEDP